MAALDARQETRSMLESTDRWENEGGRHSSQATTATSRSLAARRGHATRARPTRMAAELGIPAAAPRPIRMSGLDPSRDASTARAFLSTDTFMADTRAPDAEGEHGAGVVFDLADLRDAA
jgi:hypothetical protein